MKLPFTFATKLLFRLVWPGAFLTALFWPLLLAACGLLGIDIGNGASLGAVATLIFGWLVLLVDMPIYMLFEGRRFWPDWLRRWAVSRQQTRLARLFAKRDEIRGREVEFAERDDGSEWKGKRSIEYNLLTRDYPIDGASGSPVARSPTRLGNLLAASETYPQRKYGIDGIFAWYRIWLAIDENLRTQLDDQQALVDSALYTSFIAILAVPVLLAYALLSRCAVAGFAMLPPWPLLLGMALLSAAFGYAMYRLALISQRAYGEMFMALFDQNLDKLDLSGVIADLAKARPDLELFRLPERARNSAATRFLRWHTIRSKGQRWGDPVENW